MCNISAHESANDLKFEIHDERIDEAERGMFKCLWEAANDFEAKALPKPNRTLVGADYEIVLHGSEPALAGALQ